MVGFEYLGRTVVRASIHDMSVPDAKHRIEPDKLYARLDCLACEHGKDTDGKKMSNSFEDLSDGILNLGDHLRGMTHH